MHSHLVYYDADPLFQRSEHLVPIILGVSCVLMRIGKKLQKPSIYIHAYDSGFTI